MDYEIVRYHAGLRDGVLPLFREIIAGDDAARDAYFRWKHEENPFLHAPVVYVVLYGGHVVGVRGFLGARWRVPGSSESRLMLCTSELVVAPDHRRKGLYRRMMEVALADLCAEGHQAVLSLHANPITYPATLRMGGRAVAPYSMWASESWRMHAAERLGRTGPRASVVVAP